MSGENTEENSSCGDLFADRYSERDKEFATVSTCVTSRPAIYPWAAPNNRQAGRDDHRRPPRDDRRHPDDRGRHSGYNRDDSRGYQHQQRGDRGADQQHSNSRYHDREAGMRSQSNQQSYPPRHESAQETHHSREGSSREREPLAPSDHQERQTHNAGAVSAFYNALPDAGRESRKQSPIYFMRNINNWIKSVLINRSVCHVPDENRRLRVLDLCCGKGGDLLKWKTQRLEHLAGVDIAEVSIEQCRQRARSARLGFSTEFAAADCTQSNVKHALGTGHGPQSFHVASCQFALHYGFESEQQANRLLDNACQELSTGGIFIGTIPNADYLVWRWQQAKGEAFGNSIYQVSFDDASTQGEKPLGLYGAKYHFRLEGAVDVPEYLIYFPLLCKLLKERHNMKLLWKRSFHQFFNDESGAPRNRDLLHRMKCLDTMKGKEVGLDHDEDVGSISQDEWEAVGLYLVFCFQKQ